MVWHPRISYIVRNPIVVSGSGHTGNVLTRHRLRKSGSQVFRSGKQLALHATSRTPHGASRLVQEMSARSVKIRRTPSRHSRDARVHSHTTTVMHAIEHPPPAGPPPHTCTTCPLLSRWYPSWHYDGSFRRIPRWVGNVRGRLLQL